MVLTADSLISKLSIIFTITALIILSATAVLAQDATSPATTRKERVQDRIEARKASVEERLTNLRERIASKEATLKAKLDKFRDKQKAQIAERINKTLANINEKITAAMSRHLEKMSAILDKLEARVKANTPDIKDPAAVRSAISEARDAIAVASDAVNIQADKDYVLEATSEATIRTDMQGMKQQLHDDLRVVRQLVIDAKQKVANAIRVAKSNAKGVSSGQ